MPDVFISYSRQDSGFVRRLRDALRAEGRDVWVDLEDIPPTAEWLQEIFSAIEGADDFVFVLSPDSVASEFCRIELTHALRHKKRLVPILYREVDPTKLPEAVATRQWLRFTEDEGFDRAFANLISALDIDLDWIRFHTRLLVRAREWKTKERDRSLLLRGRELVRTEEQLLSTDPSRSPELAGLQREYIAASRRNVDRLQRITAVVAVGLILLLAVLGTAGWHWSDRLGRRSALITRMESGDLDHALSEIGVQSGSEAVLESVRLLLPLPKEKSRDFRVISGIVWTLDYFPGRTGKHWEATRELRRTLLASFGSPPPLQEEEWVDVQGGEFWMGSAEGGDFDEKPRHQVRISPFRILAHEVTNREFRQFVPAWKGEDNLPAVNVTWYQAYCYAAWLGGRLPTEAEWEYAARAGRDTKWFLGTDPTALGRYAWFRDNSGNKLHPIGRRDPDPREPNPWGLYDLLGNASEWVADWYDIPYSKVAQVNPWGPATGAVQAVHVVRGGNCQSDAADMRPAHREWEYPGSVLALQGFRVVLTTTSKEGDAAAFHRPGDSPNTMDRPRRQACLHSEKQIHFPPPLSMKLGG